MNGRVLVVGSLLLGTARADSPPPPPSETPVEVEATPVGGSGSQGAVTVQHVPTAPPRYARIEAMAMTGFTLALVGVTVYSLHRMSDAADRGDELYNKNEPVAWQIEARHQANWRRFAFACTGLVVVSAAVTAYLWSRTETTYQVAVTPSGAYVGYAHSF